MYDIALPEGNEEELAKRYLENNIRNVIFAYYVRSKKDLENFLLKNVISYKGLSIFYLAIIDTKDIKTIIDTASDLFYSERYYNDLVFIVAKDLDFNSRILNRYFYNGLFVKKLVGSEKFYFKNLDMRCIKKIKNNNQSVLISLKDAIDNPYPFKYMINVLQKKDIMILFGSFASEKSEVPNRYSIKAFYKVFGIRYSSKLMEDFLFYQVSRTRKGKNRLYFMEGYYIAKMPYEDCTEY